MSHWPCIKLAAHTVGMSAIEASQKEHDETETVSAMASLSMQQPTNLTLVAESKSFFAVYFLLSSLSLSRVTRNSILSDNL